MIDVVRRMVPWRLRQALLDARRPAILRRAVDRVRALPEHRWADAELLGKMRIGWGNMDWSAGPEYLACMARLVEKTSGPILECGSGLTTLLLGIFAARRGLEIWSLEHEPTWRKTVERSLAEHRIGNVHLDPAPLRDYGGYQWYEPSIGEMPSKFSLVICDGPPEATPGGRYGLLPVMRPYLTMNCVILLDDVERENASDILARWTEFKGVNVDPRDRECSYALVRLTTPD